MLLVGFFCHPVMSLAVYSICVWTVMHSFLHTYYWGAFCTPIVIILCEVIVDLSSVVASVKVYHVLLSMLCCVLYHVNIPAMSPKKATRYLFDTLKVSGKP